MGCQEIFPLELMAECPLSLSRLILLINAFKLHFIHLGSQNSQILFQNYFND